MKKLLFMVSLVLISACSVPGFSTSSPSIDSCADKYVKGMTSTNVVPGDFECLSPLIQQSLKDQGKVASDQDLATNAQGFQGVKTKICGPYQPESKFIPTDTTHNVKFYEFDFPDGQTAVLIVEFNKSDGKITNLSAAMGYTCADIKKV